MCLTSHGHNSLLAAKTFNERLKERLENRLKRFPDRHPEYTTGKVVDYLNERAVKEHDEALAVKNRNHGKWFSHETKPRAYYTSNESKKYALYKYNERALLEKERAKKIDYDNYMADVDYRNKPRAYYFKDPAKYKNKPKTLSEKMGRDEGPKYKFRRMRREAAKPEATTWAVVHYTRFNKSLTYNFSQEIIEQVEEHRENMKLRQVALEATGKYSLAHELGSRTKFRLPTWRNFVDEMTTFQPYTFKKDPIEFDPRLINEESGANIPSSEVTTPRNYKQWIMEQLIRYRQQYRGLTEKEPFAHYPEYTWENVGFELAKLEDPFPPIWPRKAVEYNVDVMKAHFAATETTPLPHVEEEWDSKGRERITVFKPPTRRVIIPNI
ncbi:hypothetical protein M8J75_002326 [Diaphorina citri]|nr:hypothetical protein M8J75_002326 [Diaphorina citri]